MSSLYDVNKNQQELNRNRPATTASNYPPKRSNGDTHGDHMASSELLQILSFEIEPNIAKVFVKAYNKELEDIETKFHVEVAGDETKGSKLCLKPKEECSVNDYEEACDQFITLYQKMCQLKCVEMATVEINREKGKAVDEKGRRKQSKNDEEVMDVDPAELEHSGSDKNPGNKLETFLG